MATKAQISSNRCNTTIETVHDNIEIIDNIKLI